MGYHWAGFEVEGVDNKPQPHYPFKFYQADALEFPLEGYDAYHASPPCQRWSGANKQHWKIKHPDLLTPTRDLLISTFKPYVIENVMLSPLKNWVVLAGWSFGLKVMRKRKFECNFPIMVPSFGKPPGHTYDGSFVSVSGFGGRGSRDFLLWQEAMGITWMNRKELTQAIPPAYTEYIGKYLLKAL